MLHKNLHTLRCEKNIVKHYNRTDYSRSYTTRRYKFTILPASCVRLNFIAAMFVHGDKSYDGSPVPNHSVIRDIQASIYRIQSECVVRPIAIYIAYRPIRQLK